MCKHAGVYSAAALLFALRKLLGVCKHAGAYSSAELLLAASAVHGTREMREVCFVQSGGKHVSRLVRCIAACALFPIGTMHTIY